MKKISVLSLLILFVHVVCGQINLDSGMVGYYPFLGNANDSSGNNNNGTVYGATLTFDKSGYTNSAYYFDGSSHIDIPDDSSLQPVVYTLYALIKVQGFFSGNCQGNVILWKGRDTYAGHYGLIFSDTPYDMSCFSFDSLHENFYNDQQHLNPVADTPYIYTDVWYCLVSTFDGDSLRMWVDGTLRYTAFRNPLGSNSEPVFIGYEPYAVGLEYWFHGVIDEIRIYNRVLNDAEVNSLCFPTNPIASFTADNMICPGTCIDFTNLSQNATSYEWTFTGGSPSSSTDPNPQGICYNAPGTYNVMLIATGAVGSDTLLFSNYINVYAFPPPQSITQNGDTLFAIAGSNSYQWYYNGNLITGATDYFYIAPASGDYNVVVTDTNGCEVEAVINNVLANAQFEDTDLMFEVYPNPVGSELIIKNVVPIAIGIRIETAVTISIYNLLGELAVKPQTSNLKPETSIYVSELPKGMYWLKINAGEKNIRTKFVKQ